MIVTVKLNRNGVSLVEVMIALVIALVVFLALMQTALMGIDANVRNLLRDEAVNIADQRMTVAKNLAFASLLSEASPVSVTRNVRNMSTVSFSTQRTVTELDGDGNALTDDANNKQINITVSWQWKGDSYSHSIATIRKRS